MQISASGSLIERMKGAARLQASTYEEVEHDTSATIQAAIVVSIVAIVTGIGALFSDGLSGLIGGIIASLIAWIVLAIIAYVIGTKYLAEPGTNAGLGEVLRTVGFARTPQLLSFFGFIWLIGWIFALIAWLWGTLALIVALRQALELSISKAIATAIISSIASGFVLWFIYLIFDISLPGT